MKLIIIILTLVCCSTLTTLSTKRINQDANTPTYTITINGKDITATKDVYPIIEECPNINYEISKEESVKNKNLRKVIEEMVKKGSYIQDQGICSIDNLVLYHKELFFKIKEKLGNLTSSLYKKAPNSFKHLLKCIYHTEFNKVFENQSEEDQKISKLELKQRSEELKNLLIQSNLKYCLSLKKEKSTKLRKTKFPFAYIWNGIKSLFFILEVFLALIISVPLMFVALLFSGIDYLLGQDYLSNIPLYVIELISKFVAKQSDNFY